MHKVLGNNIFTIVNLQLDTHNQMKVAEKMSAYIAV